MPRKIQLERLRNFGIIAHVDAGKTTTTERILYLTGRNYKSGDVHTGNTTTDFLPQEQQRGITIQSAAVTTAWRDHQLNLIDTPGHIDFGIEVNRSLRVLDGAVVVFDGVAGVEPQSETNWRLADSYNVPRICYVNKMDRSGANFVRCVEMIHARLGANPLVCQIPLGSEDNFRGLIDLVTMQAFVKFDNEIDTPYEVWDVAETAPGVLARKLNLTVAQDVALVADVAAWRASLIEMVVEHDEVALEGYIEGLDPTADVLRACIRKGTLAGSFTPVLCGSSYKNKGVEALLDAVIDYLPAPTDVAAIKTVDEDGDPVGTRPCSDDEPFAALAFKIENNQYGALTFARIYSGVVAKGMNILNSTKGKREKIGRIVEVHAKTTSPIEEARAGDIIAFVSLDITDTGDTLCDADHPVILERMRFPEPVISVSIEPKSKADQEKLATALNRMVRADPSLRLSTDRETGQTILRGMGELHLEVTIDRMLAEHNVAARVGPPQVAFRETIKRTVTHDYLHRKQTGGTGQMAEVKICFEPLPRGSGFEFVNAVTGGAIPREYIPAIKSGIDLQKETGVLAGYPTVDFRATLLDGSFHEVDSSALAFDIAARACFREAMRLAHPVLLEPVMKVEVVTPIEQVGDVIGDLMRRRGNLIGQFERGLHRAIDAHVPLSEMFLYIGDLRSMTSGRATYTMEFAHYAETPRSVQEEIVARVA